MNDTLPPSLIRLEAELEEAISRELAPPSPEPARGARQLLALRPRVLAGTTVGVAAAGLVLALVLSAAGSSPAFAVTRNPDGTVTVKLLRLSGIAGANRKLEAMGVRAQIVRATAMAKYLKIVRPCQGKSSAAVQTLTFNPAAIPAQNKLLLAADKAAQLGYYAAANKLRIAARSGAKPPPGVATYHALTGTANQTIRLNPNGPVAAALAKASGGPGTPKTGPFGKPTPAAGSVVRVYCAAGS